ncbi:DNA polymerase III subunit beta [Endomicrobiia bacterium]|nr:DNA polymerase III subunit beta [Endomicrobiia bacterium]GHT14353.1 DNA polymerase III subunit beta [Endomicrobiia bacterium]GHT21419.1 DNA polymerase III subunit beta [Endomicrobiia bacterium]GHT26519.1 DNA polymerase III subunit beta [Endomicrobiia bacterium]GHT31230.1 DNA polymerase III subunit beta [Endomicrobiia bacterium]
MKVICEKEELMRGIQMVSPVTPSKNTLPALSNILFEAERDKIKLSSTDLEIAVQCYIKGEITEDGGITIPSKRFANIIKELSTDDEIEIKADEINQINIKSGKSKFNLMGISKTEYPVIPEPPKNNNFTIKRGIFASMLKKIVFAASRDSQRYVLNGIYFILGDSKLTMVATDGRRLAYAKTNITQAEVKGKAIVPTKAVNDILRLLYSDINSEDMRIGISDNRISAEIDDITLLSTLIEGVFPNYEQVIPKKSDLKIKLNVKNTLTAVKQMALLTDNHLSSDRSSAVKFYFSQDLLKISASSAGIGSGETDLEIEYKNDPAEINFNPDFIKEIFQSIDEYSAIFEFTNSLNPAVIYPETDENYLCVVMPMRV